MPYYQKRYTPRSLRRVEKKAKRNIILSAVIFIVFLFFLITWGLPELVGALDVFNRFKPQNKQSSGVEDSAIPAPRLNIPFEATNSGTIRLAGYSMPNAKVELFLDDQLKAVAQTDEKGFFESSEVELIVGTNNIYGKAINEEGNRSLPSKLIRLKYNNEKPELEILSPEGDLTVDENNESEPIKDRKIKVSGVTDSSNSIVINGASVIVAHDGVFQRLVNLNEGENTITITATNQFGAKNEITRKVTLIVKPAESN